MSDLGPLQARLTEAVSHAQANAANLAVLVVHVDRLKDIHETIGRRTGEAVLQELCKRWLRVRSDGDTLADLGGGQFAILLPGANANAACDAAQLLLHALEQPVVIGGATLQVGGSIGIALHPDHGVEPDALLRRADVAADEASHSQSGYAIYIADDDHSRPERLALAADLRRAIELDQLVLHYQPQVDVRSGALTAVEALVRWHHPVRGLLAPGEFVPLAEATRMIQPLSRSVLRAAVKQCRAWHSAGLDIQVAVNLSVHDLQDPALPDHVLDLLRTWVVAPNRLCFEITETALLANPEQAREILGRLRALGVRTAIDDFGTGYSSLAYLKDLPLDELKIDRSFVQDMAADGGARAIVRAVIDLAHDLGLRAIAEGVEDVATREVLASLGCDVAQGYYFAPPMTADSLTDWTTRAVDRGLNAAQRGAVDAKRRERSGERQARLTAEEEFLARKRAEEALRASEAQYRSVVDNIKDVIFQVDAAGCWAFLNPAWEEVTGFSCEESLGQPCVQFLHPQDHGIPRKFFSGLADRVEEGCRYEIRFLTRTGEFRWVEVFARPSRDAEGQIVGASGTLSDITDRKQSEERRRTLEQTEKLRALGQMASGVAHDLNQSLGLIAGYSDIARRALEQEPPDLASLRESLPIITQAAMDSGKTVRQLLTFTRGQPDGKPEPVDVASLLHEVAELTAPRWRDAAQVEGRRINLIVDAAPALHILGRPASLRVALTNLVFNAVDAMPAGGTLTLAGRSLGDRIAVAVTDSGVGMTQEVQSRSFEPFFSTKGERGTGLGLAQVFGIMEQHGAAITVDSTPGRGTSFRLIFGAEITGAELVQSAAPEPEIGMERRLRILAVDDEPAMGSMIRRILRSDGHIVVTATSGEEALRHLTAQSFDVVISDVGMGPGMNGWDLAEEVRRRTPRVPVVLATGWGATIEPADAQAKGIDAVLAKPYLPADLKSVLAHLELPGVSVEAA